MAISSDNCIQEWLAGRASALSAFKSVETAIIYGLELLILIRLYRV